MNHWQILRILNFTENHILFWKDDLLANINKSTDNLKQRGFIFNRAPRLHAMVESTKLIGTNLEVKCQRYLQKF